MWHTDDGRKEITISQRCIGYTISKCTSLWCYTWTLTIYRQWYSTRVRQCTWVRLEYLFWGLGLEPTGLWLEPQDSVGLNHSSYSMSCEWELRTTSEQKDPTVWSVCCCSIFWIWYFSISIGRIETLLGIVRQWLQCTAAMSGVLGTTVSNTTKATWGRCEGTGCTSDQCSGWACLQQWRHVHAASQS